MTTLRGEVTSTAPITSSPWVTGAAATQDVAVGPGVHVAIECPVEHAPVLARRRPGKPLAVLVVHRRGDVLVVVKGLLEVIGVDVVSSSTSSATSIAMSLAIRAR